MTLDRAWTFHAHLHEIDPSGGTLRCRRDLMIQHQMAPVGPHKLGLATTRSTANERRQRIAALCQDATTGLESSIRVLVDEDTVRREDVRVVVAVVATGVDAVRVAIDQLRDLLIVERRKRALLRLNWSRSKLDSSSHERQHTRTNKRSNQFQIRHDISMRHTCSINSQSPIPMACPGSWSLGLGSQTDFSEDHSPGLAGRRRSARPESAAADE